MILLATLFPPHWGPSKDVEIFSWSKLPRLSPSGLPRTWGRRWGSHSLLPVPLPHIAEIHSVSGGVSCLAGLPTDRRPHSCRDYRALSLTIPQNSSLHLSEVHLECSDCWMQKYKAIIFPGQRSMSESMKIFILSSGLKLPSCGRQSIWTKLIISFSLR